MRYIPCGPADERNLLDSIGLEKLEDLFASVPGEVRMAEPLDLPGPLSEPELIESFKELAGMNRDLTSFLGGGAYRHLAPSVVWSLIQRGEFLTSYTPYQPEVSQGTLQAIFEFQTFIALLTGQDIANASLYDGATATVEAALMAARVKRRHHVVVSRALHPHYRDVLRTYFESFGGRLTEVGFGENGTTGVEALEEAVSDETAAVILGYPNFLGRFEDLERLAEPVRSRGALLVASVAEPVALAVARPPGELGADVVAGEAQAFGVPLMYGGPYVGFFATRQAHLRQMPGRLVGETCDRDGVRGYVLTLSTREQHIRREKATSNICTNEGLMALVASITLACHGREGLQDLARHNLAKARHVARLLEGHGFEPRFAASPWFNEFAVRCPGNAREIHRKLLEHDILLGVELEPYYPELENTLLVAATETLGRKDFDRLEAALKEVL